MNQTNLQDFKEKLKRVRAYMTDKNYDGMVIGRRDNFAWITFGGDNKVFRCSQEGASLLLITDDKVYLCGYTMDADRVMDEELEGLDIVKMEVKWFECSPAQKIAAFMDGKRIISDIHYEGWTENNKDIIYMQTPYTLYEKKRYKEVGAAIDRLFAAVADQIKPGMTEQEIAAIAAGLFEKEKMTVKVLLVGSDERIAKYRHPIPSDKKVEKVVLLHVASDKFGMHGNITRMICFGEVPKQLEQDYDLLNRCMASTFSMLKPGMRYRPILEKRIEILKQENKEFEMELHFPGAFTGYNIGDSEPVIENETIREDMCFDWFMTVTGAKVEELAMTAEGGAEVLSVAGYWPTKVYKAGCYACELPVILVK